MLERSGDEFEKTLDKFCKEYYNMYTILGILIAFCIKIKKFEEVRI
jgi:hypothetical protein